MPRSAAHVCHAIIGLFCRISSLSLGSFAKETYEELTNGRARYSAKEIYNCVAHMCGCVCHQHICNTLQHTHTMRMCTRMPRNVHVCHAMQMCGVHDCVAYMEMCRCAHVSHALCGVNGCADVLMCSPRIVWCQWMCRCADVFRTHCVVSMDVHMC